ncbi:MAG: hypothetical protein GDA50_08160 [Alphaproteobacteria bacterium GM202ARS2]|nr:hypothetical protein [Alphaproteobacteria bacterium GM202ARS2]
MFASEDRRERARLGKRRPHEPGYAEQERRKREEAKARSDIIKQLDNYDAGIRREEGIIRKAKVRRNDALAKQRRYEDQLRRANIADDLVGLTSKKGERVARALGIDFGRSVERAAKNLVQANQSLEAAHTSINNAKDNIISFERCKAKALRKYAKLPQKRESRRDGHDIRNQGSFPIVIDLNRDGDVGLIDVKDSQATFFRASAPNGHGWFSAENGVLALDADRSGQIDQENEIAFASWHHDARAGVFASGAGKCVLLVEFSS